MQSQSPTASQLQKQAWPRPAFLVGAVLVSELRSSQASAARAFTQSHLLSPPALTPESLPWGLGFADMATTGSYAG